MDAMMLLIAFVAFFALIAAWLVLPSSKAPVAVMPTSVSAPRRSAAQA